MNSILVPATDPLADLPSNPTTGRTHEQELERALRDTLERRLGRSGTPVEFARMVEALCSTRSAVALVQSITLGRVSARQVDVLRAARALQTVRQQALVAAVRSDLLFRFQTHIRLKWVTLRLWLRHFFS